MFQRALKNGDLSELSQIPKSDLHNHGGRGGNVRVIAAVIGRTIPPPPATFASLWDMQIWYNENIKQYCPYIRRLEASFQQAADDHIRVFATSYDVSTDGKIGGMELAQAFRTIDSFRNKWIPDTVFLPELTYDRGCNTEFAVSQLDEILSYGWFRSIDICGDEFAQPIQNFEKLYRKAKDAGLRLKAHVGEFGTAEDVMEAVETLELDEVHHGVAAAQSPFVMRWLSDTKTQLNVCPTSNVKLKVAESYANHPIKTLVHHGVPVTVNTDDMLIFDQSVSQDYLNLYQNGVLTIEELDRVRETGLNEAAHYLEQPFCAE